MRRRPLAPDRTRLGHPILPAAALTWRKPHHGEIAMNFHNASFAVYWIALVACGGLLVAMGGTRFGRMSRVEQAANVLVGLAFAGYGIYLGFAVDVARAIYLIAFAVPAILVANNIGGWRARRKVAKMTAYRPGTETNSSGMPVVTGSMLDATTLANAQNNHMKNQPYG
jgi:hypothetical protein